jgi:hypothetical protein
MTVAATPDREAPLAADELLDEARQEREVVGKLGRDRLEVALDRARGVPARALLRLAALSPLGELPRDRFLDRLATSPRRRGLRSCRCCRSGWAPSRTRKSARTE